jgi:hypothetical protein
MDSVPWAPFAGPKTSKASRKVHEGRRVLAGAVRTAMRFGRLDSRGALKRIGDGRSRGTGFDLVNREAEAPNDDDQGLTFPPIK